MQLITLPNLLSVSRIPLGALMFWFVYDTDWVAAVIILWLAIGTDVADGYIARASNTTSALGGTLDHGSDAFFVTAAIIAHVSLGLAPFALALIIPLAFLQYLLDSQALSGQPLKASFIGRYNGVAYFIFAGWPVMQHTIGLTIIPFDWFIWIGWGLVATSVISMADRLITLFAQRSDSS